jgi:N-glycosylase/DNA lyase
VFLVEDYGTEISLFRGDPARFRRLFRLDEDYQGYIEQIEGIDPNLSPCIQEHLGLRLLSPISQVESFFSFLCTPNNHLARIQSMVWKLSSFGEEIAEVEGLKLHQFPSASEIAAIGEPELRKLGFGYRAKTITGIAIEVGSRGDSWLEEIGVLPYEELRRELLRIPGIGRKLADCICLFAYGKTESVPLDVHLWRQLTQRYFPELANKAITEARYELVAQSFRQKFGQLSAYAHQYLFFESLKRGRAVK